MIRNLCILLVLSSPLYAYSFGNYYNFKSGGSSGNTYRIATADIDGSSFRTYVEVSLANPATVCALVVFGAITPVSYDGTDILALTLAPSGSVVQITDLIGDSGTNSIKKAADVQDWKFVSSSSSDPSYNYNSGTWKAEVQRPYAKGDAGKDYGVKRPGDSGVQPVAFAVFNGACPKGAFDYGTFSAVMSTWYLNDLRPSRPNFSTIAIFGWITTFVLFALLH